MPVTSNTKRQVHKTLQNFALSAAAMAWLTQLSFAATFYFKNYNQSIQNLPKEIYI